MTRTHPTDARLGDAASDRDTRFIGTVVIPLYNHAAFIEARVQSLCEQWFDGIEILLIDDASDDRGFVIAEEVLARFPHVPVTTCRNAERLGIAVIPLVLQLARSDVLIQADSDDIALPTRLRMTIDCFKSDPQCRLVTSNAVLLSEDGSFSGMVDTISRDEILADPLLAASQVDDRRWLGATMAFHRSLFEALPLIDAETCPYGLDLLLPFRALLLGTHHYVSMPLVGWRQHSRNTHRIVGATDTTVGAAERYQALELLVLRQKLKDAEYCKAANTGKPTDDHLIDICRSRFVEKFDSWARLRTAAARQEMQPGRQTSCQLRRPPVTTMIGGQRISFDTPFGGTVLSHWPGFYAGEAWGVWTARHAMFCVHVHGDDVSSLRLAISGLFFKERQRARLSVDLDPWIAIDLHQSDIATVDLPLRGTGPARVFLTAEDADSPPGDCRVLGVAMHWLEAVGREPRLERGV